MEAIEGALTERIIGCAIEVHRQLGPGLLESTYQTALGLELAFNRIQFECERHKWVDVPIRPPRRKHDPLLFTDRHISEQNKRRGHFGPTPG